MFKRTCLLGLFISSLLCGVSFGADNAFTGAGDGVSYSDPANWSLGALSTSSDDTYIGKIDPDDNFNVTLDIPAVTNQIKIGIPETGGDSFTLNVETGASLDGYRLYMGPYGTLNINDGVFDVDVFYGAAGNINIAGGSFNVGTSWAVVDCVINLCGGEIVFAGDKVAAVQTLVSQSKLVVYGLPGGSINNVYDSGTNTTTVSASCNLWTGNGNGVSWSDSANWSKGTLPVYNTNSSEFTLIGTNAGSDYDVTINGNASGGRVWLGRSEDPAGTYTLNLEDGANYYLVRMYVGSQGVLNMNSGLLDTWEGKFEDAVVKINGGTFTVRSYAWHLPGSTVMTLNGGTFRIKNGGQNRFSADLPDGDFTSMNPNFTGVMDFRGGELVMDGDCRVPLEAHITNGNIIFHGDAPDAEYEMIYEANAGDYGTTTLRAVMKYAEVISPANAAEITLDDRYAARLVWQAGVEAPAISDYKVYFGTDPAALSLVDTVAYPADPNYYLATSLTLDTTYYWRVDEVEEGTANEIQGTVWSFTTAPSLWVAEEVHVGGSDYAFLDCEWIGLGNPSNWSDQYNWTPAKPDYVRLRESINEIRMSVNTTISQPEGVDRFWMGRTPATTQDLTIADGGELYMSRLYAGANSSLTLDGGDLSAYFAFFSGSDLTINSGLLTVRSYEWYFNGGATVVLNGGTIRIHNNSTSIQASGGFGTCTVDFNGGEMIFDGDRVDVLTTILNSGKLFSSNPNYEVQIEYNGSVTRIFAEDTVAARYTWPSNGMTLTVDDRQTIQLNWTAGKDTPELEGYNVYIADSNTVPLSLVSDPVTPYTGTNWQITNVTLGNTYYWRVDEVVAGTGEIITGPVWTVTIDDALLIMYGRTWGTDTQLWQWIGCGDGTSWKDELNWHSEDPAAPIPQYNGYEGKILESRMSPTDYSIDGRCYGGFMFLGYDGLQQSIDISSGDYLQLYRLLIGGSGSLNMEAGSSAFFAVLSVDYGGEIYFEGNAQVTSKYWSFKQDPNGKGGLKLLDGELWLKTMRDEGSEPFKTGETGNIDIYEGVIKINGEHLTRVQGWVDDGYIIPYGGVEPNSIVDVYYDVDVDQTFISARDDRRKAYSPLPSEASPDADINAGLSWIVGSMAATDTLYMTTGLQSDFNDDGIVNTDDLFIMATNYLDESWLAADAADASGDYQVNMRDLSVMASEWQTVFTMDEIAIFSHDPNNNEVGPDERFDYAASLDYDTTYYWRVDTNAKNGDVITGDMWTFTTGSDPMLAYNEYPVDGDNYIVNGSIVLAWETDAAISSSNVYFADNYGEVDNAVPVEAVSAGNTTGQWTCPALITGKRYFWRVDTIEGTTTRKGKVWSFKVVDTPLGLYVDNGTLKLAGQEFKGYGVNYITAFTRTALAPNDTSYEEGFAVLGERGIPFARIWGAGFYVSSWALYFEDKELYFENFDRVMASAEENNVGIILSMFWTWYTLPDVAGGHIIDLANPNSDTTKFMENYIREVYERYKNCPAFYGWELGNEYNLSAERNSIAPDDRDDYGHPTTRTSPEDVITLDVMRDILDNFVAGVRKVDKNRMISSGLSVRVDVVADPYQYGTLPERAEDHAATDVMSIHTYYSNNGVSISTIQNAVAAADSWNKPLFVGEFGAVETDPVVATTYNTLITDLYNSGVTFAAVWVYDYANQEGTWNVTDDNSRSYMLDALETVNANLQN